MKVTGFSFIRNAVKYDYPIVEAITSILPICDDFQLALGNSEDDTESLIKGINSDKIKITRTTWDDTLKKDGKVLAVETDKAFDSIPSDTDWAFYIQGDEVVHEKYLPIIKDAMVKYKNDKDVDGLLFQYEHFFGSYEYVGDSRRWYRREIRIIKNNKNIRSYRDAQGFRKRDNSKLKVKEIDAYIYHYGWVKNPIFQQRKSNYFHTLWNGGTSQEASDGQTFDYSFIDSLALFKGTHPTVMKPRVQNQSWDFKFDLNKKQYSLRYGVLMFIERLTGWRIGEYKNFKKV
ncbi:MAG TPA: glycosyltransferase family 2 protein [Cytophagaceae bacterium]|jgi:hypothetical protein